MDVKEVYDKIDDLLVKWLGVQLNQIKPESDLSEDLCCDSIDLVEFFLALEEAFDFDLDNYEIDKCSNVNDVRELTLNKLGVNTIPNYETKSALIEVNNCTFTSSDIFQQMLKVAQDNNLFIQFDGFTDNSKDTIVVTHTYSDTEYVVTNKQEFDKLVESFKVLENFERVVCNG